MNEIHDSQEDEARIEALLRGAGPRVVPPADLAEEVRAAVHQEWQQLVAHRTRHRRVRWLAAAASLGAIVMTGIATMVATADAPQMAIAMRIDGPVTRDAGWLHPARAVSAQGSVYVGDRIETAPDSRAAFVVDNGISLRIDVASQVRLVDANRIMLEQGAVYVDVEPGTHEGATFVVATQRGTVRHIGTQYEVRSAGHRIEVSVREGRVIIDSSGRLHEGRAGEQLAIDNEGVVARSTLGESDAPWQWIHAIAPTFEIENRSLGEFLSWFSRETGQSVEFASPQLAQDAQRTILRGSIQGLEPRAALETVLATSNLALVATDQGTLLVQARD